MLHVATRGAGPDVVVLHGTPQDPDSFLGTLRGVRMHVVHLPGYGRSTQTVAISDLAAVERAIEDAIAALQIDPPVLVGCSGGAYRALSIALAGRVRLRGLGLVGGFAALSPEHREALLGSAEALVGGALDLGAVVESVGFSEAFREREPQPVRRYVEGTCASAPHAVIADDLRAIAASSDLGPSLRVLGIPVVVAVGEHDASTPIAYSQALAEGLDTEVRTIAGAGHVLHVEAPEAWQAVVDDLLAGQP